MWCVTYHWDISSVYLRCRLGMLFIVGTSWYHIVQKYVVISTHIYCVYAHLTNHHMDWMVVYLLTCHISIYNVVEPHLSSCGDIWLYLYYNCTLCNPPHLSTRHDISSSTLVSTTHLRSCIVISFSACHSCHVWHETHICPDILCHRCRWTRWYPTWSDVR